QDEILAGARASAPGYKVFHEVGNRAFRLSRESTELQRVANDVVGHRNFADDFLKLHDFAAVEHRLEIDLPAHGRQADNLKFFFFGRVAHKNVEHEPVELRL